MGKNDPNFRNNAENGSPFPKLAGMLEKIYEQLQVLSFQHCIEWKKRASILLDRIIRIY